MSVTISVMRFPALFLSRPDLSGGDQISPRVMGACITVLSYNLSCVLEKALQQEPLNPAEDKALKKLGKYSGSPSWAGFVTQKLHKMHNASCPERPPQQREPEPWAKWSQWTFMDI